ncbi:hypothetical protein SPO2306 [Ruegeria pomeroyi DSS-3]|uniref:Uncharacterized protein n=2 Tax=Ruegeria pomeroyi TaxID=89184 RepID=Q5LR26_RUEPO|nr:hypothetical protein SPO2306 [Ruegeria pomeroyi DSS-3]
MRKGGSALHSSPISTGGEIMTLRTICCAAALALVPVASLAMGCSSRGHEQTQSCAPGMQWDAASQACVEVINS